MKIATTRGRVTNQTTLAHAAAPHGAPTAGPAPYFRGPNVLTDPGFENHVFNSGGWHWLSRPDENTNYVLPRIDLTSPSWLRWPNGQFADKSLGGWAQATTPYTGDGTRYDSYWKVSVHDPHGGDYHAVWWMFANGSGLPPAEICAFSPWIDAPFSARVNPGDAITWSARLKVEATTGTPQARPYLRFFRPDFSSNGTALGTFANLTTSYTQYSVSTTAPPSSHYVRACFAFLGGSGNDRPVFLDSAILGVT